LGDFLLVVLEDESAHASQSPAAMADLIDQRARFADGLRRAGQLKDAGRLRPSKEGKRVRSDGDRLHIQGGPFAEDGKSLAAYYWVQASGVDEAAKLASECPALAGDEVEVRPLMKGKVDADKDTKPGKILAFAVLGNAASEEAWVKVMDRIDASSVGRSVGEGFLGGVRLQPPRSGRRVATRGEKRVAFDGPFLEAKEVIGGLFFRRMTSVDEAVRWAAETPFVALGTLEIREVWRS
jgi:hypothetical protein